MEFMGACDLTSGGGQNASAYGAVAFWEATDNDPANAQPAALGAPER
jgi:hypothetical protein